jgi:hypothetical protein
VIMAMKKIQKTLSKKFLLIPQISQKPRKKTDKNQQKPSKKSQKPSKKPQKTKNRQEKH